VSGGKDLSNGRCYINFSVRLVITSTIIITIIIIIIIEGIPDGLIHLWTLSSYEPSTNTWSDTIGTAHLVALNNGYNVGQTIIGSSSQKAITLQNGAIIASNKLTATISTRTLSWWVSINSLQQTAGGFGISTADYDKMEAIVWNERASNQGWFFGSSSYGRSGSIQAFASSTSLNTWYMVTAVYDTDYKMYVDDTLLFSIPNAGYLQTFSDPYRYLIGPRAFVGSNTWGYIDGAVGETMVWGRAISSTEVRSLYGSTYLTYKGKTFLHYYHHCHHHYHFY